MAFHKKVTPGPNTADVIGREAAICWDGAV
jgi:hypothetical protein